MDNLWPKHFAITQIFHSFGYNLAKSWLYQMILIWFDSWLLELSKLLKITFLTPSNLEVIGHRLQKSGLQKSHHE
jgi:hypothetical protein